MNKNTNFEVIIIGGSYAGLSAAMALGRSLRNVLIIDGGLPCNRQTPQSHNFITQDGVKPSEISAIAKAQVLNYKTIEFLEDRVVKTEKVDTSFYVTTEAGKEFRGSKLIFATGIKDIMPNINGFSESWGISVIHCPYCHGYEFRTKKTGIMANGKTAIHLASLVNNLTDGLTILTQEKVDFDSEELLKLKTHNIKIIEKEILEIEHEFGQIKCVVFKDGSKNYFDAIYAKIPFTQHSDGPFLLGCEFTEQGFIQVDSMQKTTIEGVFACGDNCLPMRSVSNSVATGNIAGAAVNMELTLEQF